MAKIKKKGMRLVFHNIQFTVANSLQVPLARPKTTSPAPRPCASFRFRCRISADYASSRVSSLDDSLRWAALTGFCDWFRNLPPRASE
jgi:hypothetical protein